jgi:hypothetical protein
LASSLTRRIPTVLGALLLAATLFTAYTATQVRASGEPANKAGAAGSDVDQVDDATAILSDTIRVSSPEDAIIMVSAECSILTSLETGGANADTATALGSVRLWVEIDGKRVPVSTDDTEEDGDDPVEDDGDTSDIGEVTFCNRAYSRSVADSEGDGEVDEEKDYIDTRTANAFNWMALDLGTFYDDLDNGQNIIEVVLWADFDEEVSGADAIADAFVGSRTMIIEPTKVSNDETVDAYNPSPAPTKK